MTKKQPTRRQLLRVDGNQGIRYAHPRTSQSLRYLAGLVRRTGIRRITREDKNTLMMIMLTLELCSHGDHAGDVDSLRGMLGRGYDADELTDLAKRVSLCQEQDADHE